MDIKTNIIRINFIFFKNLTKMTLIADRILRNLANICQEDPLFIKNILFFDEATLFLICIVCNINYWYSIAVFWVSPVRGYNTFTLKVRTYPNLSRRGKSGMPLHLILPCYTFLCGSLKSRIYYTRLINISHYYYPIN